VPWMFGPVQVLCVVALVLVFVVYVGFGVGFRMFLVAVGGC